MKTLFIHELKQNRRSAIIWILSLTAISAFYLSLYPSFAEAGAALNKFIMSFPDALRKALGMSLDPANMLASFYAMVIGYVTLAGAIQAMNIGTGIVSKEERSMTAEFLLAKPIKRTTILTAKLAVVALIIATTNLFFIVVVWLVISSFANTNIDTSTYLLISATLLFVQLFFASLGFFISVSAKRVKSVLSVSLATVFGFYIVGILDSVLGAEATRYLTPFKFVDPQYVIKHNSYEWIYLVIEAVFIVAAISAGYLIYLRRDIKSI